MKRKLNKNKKNSRCNQIQAGTFWFDKIEGARAKNSFHTAQLKFILLGRKKTQNIICEKKQQQQPPVIELIVYFKICVAINNNF